MARLCCHCCGWIMRHFSTKSEPVDDTAVDPRADSDGLFRETASRDIPLDTSFNDTQQRISSDDRPMETSPQSVNKCVLEEHFNNSAPRAVSNDQSNDHPERPHRTDHLCQQKRPSSRAASSVLPPQTVSNLQRLTLDGDIMFLRVVCDHREYTANNNGPQRITSTDGPPEHPSCYPRPGTDAFNVLARPFAADGKRARCPSRSDCSPSRIVGGDQPAYSGEISSF